jgi:hypothetical protein
MPFNFQANGVDFYINGHDHCLEHISSRDRSVSVIFGTYTDSSFAVVYNGDIFFLGYTKDLRTFVLKSRNSKNYNNAQET